MRQEALIHAHCLCLVCSRRWVVTKERRYTWDLACCGSVRVREVPTQLMLGDAGGAWVRPKAVTA